MDIKAISFIKFVYFSICIVYLHVLDTGFLCVCEVQCSLNLIVFIDHSLYTLTFVMLFLCLIILDPVMQEAF